MSSSDFDVSDYLMGRSQYYDWERSQEDIILEGEDEHLQFLETQDASIKRVSRKRIQ